jgi:non-heme chloroperoxidase
VRGRTLAAGSQVGIGTETQSAQQTPLIKRLPTSGLKAPRFSYVPGAHGVPLSVAETGHPDALGVLFIHGLGQSHLSFSAQLESPLAERFHLVAFDLRGHGNSGKPWEASAYSESRAWADDVAAMLWGLR